MRCSSQLYYLTYWTYRESIVQWFSEYFVKISFELGIWEEPRPTSKYTTDVRIGLDLQCLNDFGEFGVDSSQDTTVLKFGLVRDTSRTI